MLLNFNNFFVKEEVEFLKLTSTYKIFDPATNQLIGVAKDEPTSLNKYLRLLIGKQVLPTDFNIYDTTGQKLFTIHKNTSFFKTRVDILKNNGEYLGYLLSKIFTIGGAFDVFDKNGLHVAEIKGDWKGWNFAIKDDLGEEIGLITKKWAGIGKELFTTADNYMISINQNFKQDTNKKMLLLAGALSIDTIFKEKNS